jgi:hypothetical protein
MCRAAVFMVVPVAAFAQQVGVKAGTNLSSLSAPRSESNEPYHATALRRRSPSGQARRDLVSNDSGSSNDPARRRTPPKPRAP